jgi:hypothetical protein
MNNNTAESPNNTDAVSEIEEITNDFMSLNTHYTPHHCSPPIQLFLLTLCALSNYLLTYQLAVNVFSLYFSSI